MDQLWHKTFWILNFGKVWCHNVRSTMGYTYEFTIRNIERQRNETSEGWITNWQWSLFSLGNWVSNGVRKRMFKEMGIPKGGWNSLG